MQIKHDQSCLSSQFEMKDLRDARRILGMDIIRDRKKSSLVLSLTSYVKKILSRFFMNHCKPVNVPLASHFVLSKDQSPQD